MKYFGKLVRVDVGSGKWVLETSKGTFEIEGKVPAEMKGMQVQIDGEVEESFGFAMLGGTRTIRLSSIKPT